MLVAICCYLHLFPAFFLTVSHYRNLVNHKREEQTIMATTTTKEKTMKAAIATGFGDIDTHVHVHSDWPVPPPPKHCELTVRVLACALAPGDVRVLSGKTDYVQMPASGHPYVIGSDVAGIVTAVAADDEPKFAVGDYVVARFDEPRPNGGVAEYRNELVHLTEHCPAEIPPLAAAGLTASAAAAKRVTTDFVRSGDRVLVIGASGGVGTSVLQYCKRARQASFVAAVSTQEELCRSLGADQVVDYRTANWWQVPDFCDHPFDVVIDLVNGENWTRGACAGTAVKPNGTYVALLSGVATEMEAHGILDIVSLVFGMVGRQLYSRLHPRLPNWVVPKALALQDGDLRELLQDVQQGRLQPTLDPSSPFEFTEQGVRDAMKLQKSTRAHGKVVIRIAND